MAYSVIQDVIMFILQRKQCQHVETAGEAGSRSDLCGH